MAVAPIGFSYMKLTDEERLALNCLSTESLTPAVRVGRVVWPVGNHGEMVSIARANVVLNRLKAYGLVRWEPHLVPGFGTGKGGWIRIKQ